MSKPFDRKKHSLPPTGIVCVPISDSNPNGYAGAGQQFIKTGYVKPVNISDGKYQQAENGHYQLSNNSDIAGDVIIGNDAYTKTGTSLKAGNCYWVRPADGLVLSWDGPYGLNKCPVILPALLQTGINPFFFGAFLAPRHLSSFGLPDFDQNTITLSMGVSNSSDHALNGYLRRSGLLVSSSFGGDTAYYYTFHRYSEKVYCHGKQLPLLPLGAGVLGCAMVGDIIVCVTNKAGKDSKQDDGVKIYYGQLSAVASSGWLLAGVITFDTAVNEDYLAHCGTFSFSSDGLQIIGLHHSVNQQLPFVGALHTNVLNYKIIRISLTVNNGVISIAQNTEETIVHSEHISDTVSKSVSKVEAVGFRGMDEVVIKWDGNYGLSGLIIQAFSSGSDTVNYTLNLKEFINGSPAATIKSTTVLATDNYFQAEHPWIDPGHIPPTFKVLHFEKDSDMNFSQLLFADIASNYYVFSDVNEKCSGVFEADAITSNGSQNPDAGSDLTQSILHKISTNLDGDIATIYQNSLVTNDIPFGGNLADQFLDTDLKKHRFPGYKTTRYKPLYKRFDMQSVVDENGQLFLSINWQANSAWSQPIWIGNYIDPGVFDSINFTTNVHDFNVGLVGLKISGQLFPVHSIHTDNTRKTTIGRI